MSRIRADQLVNRTAVGAPELPNGMVVSGICTTPTVKHSSFDNGATDVGAYQLTSGSVFIQKLSSDTSTAIGVYNGSGSTQTIDIKGDGSATFSSLGTFKNDLRVQDGGNFRVRLAADATSDAVLLQNNGNVTATGVGAFNSTLKGNTAYAASVIGGEFYANSTSGSYPALLTQNFQSGINFQGKDSGGTVTSQINTNGSSVFSSTLALTGGHLQVDRPGGSDDALKIYENSVLRSYILNGGSAYFFGQVQLAGGFQAKDLLKEEVNITAGKLSDNPNIYLTNGMVHYFTTQETTTVTPNITYSGSTTLMDSMSVGEAVTVNIITTAAAGAYSSQVQVDGVHVTERWIGGTPPSGGGTSGVDIHSYTIIKIGTGTGDSGWYVIANHSKTS